jgi:hypothetical protein
MNKLMNMPANMLINILVYQLCWFACILGGANGMPLLGVAMVMLAGAYHLFNAPVPRSEFLLMVIVAVIGGAWDSLLVAMGWLVYPSGTLVAGTAPYWMVALWAAFAMTFNVSLRWFKQHLALAALFGAVGGPLAYLAGEGLGGVVFTSYPAGLGALALGWTLLMPLMLLIAKHFDDVSQSPEPAPAPS